jgi:hypothetical protein
MLLGLSLTRLDLDIMYYVRVLLANTSTSAGKDIKKQRLAVTYCTQHTVTRSSQVSSATFARQKIARAPHKKNDELCNLIAAKASTQLESSQCRFEKFKCRESIGRIDQSRRAEQKTTVVVVVVDA